MSQQKKKTKQKYIGAKELAEIISYDAKNQFILELRLTKLGLSKDAPYGLEQHIQYIKSETKNRGFAEHIFVKEFKEPTFIKEIGCKIPYKYKVTMSNLEIEFSQNNALSLCMHRLETQEYSVTDYKPSGIRYSGGLYFEFEGNTIFNFDPIDGLEHFMNVFLGHNATLSFIENRFKGANIVARVQKTAVTILEFKKNISENPISIGRRSSEESSSVVNSWRLKKGIRGKIDAANRIQNFINESNVEENNKIKVTPEQVEGADDKCIIRISDNKFDELSIFGMTNFYFEGKNVIKQLTPYAPSSLEAMPGEMSIASSIHWGAHQKLDEGGEYFLAHKKIFAILKQRAIANGDATQEIILQREIAKCDHGIAKSEKGWDACQDKIIFGFSKKISNYGASWIRPLGWLVGLNVLVVGLIYITIKPNVNSNLLVTFFELFNPTSYLPKLLELKGAGGAGHNAWISFLFISQKVILAFTLYEMIKIFRRFGRR